MKGFKYQGMDWSPLRSGNEIGGIFVELVAYSIPTQYVILRSWEGGEGR